MICDFDRQGAAFVCRRPGCGRVVHGLHSAPRAMCRADGFLRPPPIQTALVSSAEGANAAPAIAPTFQPPPTAPLALHRPGTRLRLLLSDLGIQPREGCRCHETERDMDRAGIDGCRVRRHEFAGRLKDDAAAYGWRDQLPAAAKALRLLGPRAISFLARPYLYLVDEAVRRADAARTCKIATCHLIYHIWPVAASDLWRWNVAQLYAADRIEQFNGRRVVAIALDDLTATITEVSDTFAALEARRLTSGKPPRPVEFIELPNDPRLREAASFLDLLDAVETIDRSHATFYAHAKGVSRNGQILEPIQSWTETLYHENLDHAERVRETLTKRSMYGVRFTAEARWRYPGSFFWFRNADLFSQPDWRSLRNTVSKEGPGWAAEAFSHERFADDECGGPTLQLAASGPGSRSLYRRELWGLGSAMTLAEGLAVFDEQAYLSAFPDVAGGVADGIFTSGREHYTRFGFDENRPPDGGLITPPPPQ